MLSYALVRDVHIGCASLSISLFAARGALRLKRPAWQPWPWLRVLPHINDTLLLCAAITLAMMSGQYPIQQPWLTAKVIALMVYVGFGMVALRPSTPPGRRKVAFVVAILTVLYIVGVAITKSASWGMKLP